MRKFSILSRILLSSFVFLAVENANSQCPNGLCALNRNSPCAQFNPGNVDIPTYDLIRSLHLEEAQSRFPGVAVIPGSIATQTAYSLRQESNLTVNTFEAFPRGLPFHFSFESTFRNRETQQASWNLVHVTNPFEQSQFSVTFDESQKLIGIALPDVMGNVQRVYFRHSSIFDRSWHKIMLSVANDQATLWIDCIPVPGVRGDYAEPLLPRRKFDASGGHVYVSQIVDEYSQRTALIDLQWMVLSCDATRPLRQNCEELPQYQEAVQPEKPEIVLPLLTTPAPIILQNTQRQECPVICPQGPAGRDGVDGKSFVGERGSKGERGERGEHGFPGVPGESIVGLPGEKGERGFDGEKGERGLDGLPGAPGFPGIKGEPGVIITRVEGETHEYGELEVRQICLRVVQEELEKIRPSLIGPPGPPGKARAGRPGPKGEPGLSGRNGMPGLPGAKGHHGFNGIQGEKGEKGEDGVGRPGLPGPQGLQGVAGLEVVGPPGHPGQRGESGRPGTPGPRGEPGTPGDCPHDCYYQMQYMQQLQAAQAQQQSSKGPTPLSLNLNGNNKG